MADAQTSTGDDGVDVPGRRVRGGGLDSEEAARKRAEREQAKKAQALADREELIERQRAVTGELLDAIGAESLLVVDDEAFSAFDYLTAVATAPNDIENIGDEELDPRTENAAWSQSVQEAWEQRKEDERASLLQEARQLLRTETRFDLSPLHWLQEIFPSGRIRIITPQTWEAEGEQLTADEPPPLVLFDQDLGGYSRTGIDLLREYRGGRKTEVGLQRPAGILSAIVSEQGELLSGTPGELEKVPGGSLMMISKAHLSEDKLGEAVQLLRLTGNLPHLESARDHVLNGLVEDMQQAAEATRGLPPRVLEDLVYRSSYVEGAWEGGTLARVAGLLLTEATRDRELGDNQLAEVVTKARRLARSVDDAAPESPTEAGRLHRIENYAPQEWINQLRLPIANGDLFRLDGADEPRFFVLVAQPCDLVLRPAGKRDVDDARLLPIVQRKHDGKVLEHPLPAVPPEPLPDACVAMLKQGFHVSMDALDLCWFNEGGQAVIEDVETIDKDQLLTEGMTLRRAFLRHEARRLVDHLDVLSKRSERELGFAMEQQAQGTVPLSYDTATPMRLAYPLTRIGRLSPHQAEALLVRYAAAQARAAFDHRLDQFTDR